jgi:hypothetical protein
MDSLIRDEIEKYAEMLPMNKSISFTDAEKRAACFLTIMAKIVNWKHLLTNDKIRLLSIQTATFAQEMSKGTAKTVTENKLTAEASTDYTKAREDLEGIENDISYLKAYLDLYNNAHVFYRQVSKEANI